MSGCSGSKGRAVPSGSLTLIAATPNHSLTAAARTSDSLSIMLFSYAVRALYIESCSMFVRGGVYKVVHEALGGTLAKFSVSALMFDYVLTGPISSVSAGLYLAGLVNEVLEYLHLPKMPLS